MQKINFITHFFLMILLRNSKLVVLSNLGMPGHKHIKWQYHFEGTFDVYLQAKNQLYPPRFPWDIGKILQTCNFGYFGHAWPHTPKVISSTCRKLLCLSAGKKSGFSATFFWRFCKYMQTCYFGTLVMPGYAHTKW